MTQVSELAEMAADRTTRVAACEFLHAITLWMIGMAIDLSTMFWSVRALFWIDTPEWATVLCDAVQWPSVCLTHPARALCCSPSSC